MEKIENLYYRKFHLADELTPIVKYAWMMNSFEKRSKKDLLIPDGYPEIIFVQQGSYCKELLSHSQKPVIVDQSCIIGIQTQTVLASRMNYCRLVGLKLRPAGAYALFGNRLKCTAGKNVPLTDFRVDWLTDLSESIRLSKNERSIKDILNERLIRETKSIKDSRSHKLATSYINSILAVRGQISVKDLAKNHHISLRHFQRTFTAFFGLSPKKFLNLIRFKHTYKSSVLQKKDLTNYTGYGYYDQMHFIKDFRKKLGITPSESSDFTFLQRNIMAKISS
jgi:AraC-like DNA-binding protein